MFRTSLESAAVSLATFSAPLVIFFFLGSYTYLPTGAAASLKGIPAVRQAARIAANTKTISGPGYAVCVATDPAMRSAGSTAKRQRRKAPRMSILRR